MKVFQTELEVREGQSGRILMTLRDEAGALVPKSALDSVTVDLYRWANDADQVINDRDGQDVLDVNGGEFFDELQTAVDEDGNSVQFNFAWRYTPADTPYLGADVSRHQTEVHIAHFRFVWDDGDKGIGHEIKMKVTNFRRFPAETT